MRDLDEPGEGVPPALRTFAGRSLAERQFDLALDLGCTVVACCIDRLAEPVLDLQHRAEGQGVQFLIVRAGRGLAGAATVSDEILVFAPGLMPDTPTCAALLTEPVVLTLPAERALALGYERIDADGAWAGALVARGAVLERLAQLPDDADITSSLLRLALQAGTRRRSLNTGLLDDGAWQLAPSQEDLDRRAERWLDERAALASFAAPGRALIERIALRLARGSVGKRPGYAPALTGLLAACGALGFAVFEMPVAALALALAASFLAVMTDLFARIADGPREQPARARFNRALESAVDPALVIAMTAAAPEADGWLRLFVPVVLFLSLAIAARHGPPRYQPLLGDRTMLAAILLPAAVFGISQILAGVLAIAALLTTLLGRRGD